MSTLEQKLMNTTETVFTAEFHSLDGNGLEKAKKYADRFGVNHDIWWLLTGNKKTIYDFALQEVKLGLEDGEGVDSNFIHTQKMVLIDKDRVVRGYYDGLDSMAMKNLAEDIVLLMLEKDKKKKRNLFRK
jgi:protein SCO1/2